MIDESVDLLICPKCGATNRVPRAPEAVNHRCGSCRGEFCPVSFWEDYHIRKLTKIEKITRVLTKLVATAFCLLPVIAGVNFLTIVESPQLDGSTVDIRKPVELITKGYLSREGVIDGGSTRLPSSNTISFTRDPKSGKIVLAKSGGGVREGNSSIVESDLIKQKFLEQNGGPHVKFVKAQNLGFVFIHPGTFTMGSSASEEGFWGDENQVEVTLSRPFWLAKTEVTQAQWEAVMGSNPSSFKGANLPVENVSWEDVQAFIAKLNVEKILPPGWEFALPTEAQWEYACRAGEKGPYSGGGLDEVGWYSENSDSRTHEVGQKKPNGWGLHDMFGNVWEWCTDCYDGTLKGGTDPTGPSSGDRRVNRGGSFLAVSRNCRAAFRFCLPPGSCKHDLGFRLALVPSR